MNEQWREEMRAKMEGYGEQPPRMDWAAIEQAVAERKRHDRRHAVTRWSRRIAAAAVVLLVVTATVRLVMPDAETPQGQQRTQRPATSMATATDGHHTPTNGTARPDTPGTSLRHSVRAARSLTAQVAPPAATSPAITTTAPGSPAGQDTPSPLPAKPAAPEEPVSTATTKKSTSLPSTHDPFPPEPQPRRRHIAMGAYLSDAPSSQTTIGSPVMMLAAADPIGNYCKDMSSEAADETQPSTIDKETTVRHSRPVRIGLSLRYALSTRWSIETGLTYTYLHSEITQRAGHSTHTAAQRLHYLGVPVGLSYNIWRTNRISIYAAANVMAEKSVAGTETVSRLQFSAGSAVGAELSIGSGIGLYVEPGVTHRFDNHSTVPTIYKDRPTDFNLDLGLRLNLR